MIRMLQKIRCWPWLVLVFALVVVFAIVWRTSAPIRVLHPMTEKLSVTDAQSARPGRIANVSRRSRAGDVSKPFSGATTADQFRRQLDTSAIAPGEKQQYRVLIASICDPKTRKVMDYLQKRDANKPVVSASKKLSSSFSYGYFKAFCNGSEIEMWREAEGFEQIDPSDETLQSMELIGLEEAGEAAFASERALDLLSNSTSPEAVSRAMDHLLGTGSSLPLGSDLPFPNATAQENFDAHRIATARWRCDLRGGCGTGEFFSVVVCQSLQNCRPGITVDAAWRQSYRPGVLARAEEIHRRLAALHAKSASARHGN